MSLDTAQGAPGLTGAPETLTHRPPRKRRLWRLAALLLVLILIGSGIAAVLLLKPFASSKAPATPAGSASPTALAEVARKTLTSQLALSGTLGYAGNYDTINQAQGILTSVPDIGRVVTQGQILYRVNNQPVVLLYGTTPISREMKVGDRGTDVAQLNSALVAIGATTKEAIGAGTNFYGDATVAAVKRFQLSFGLEQTGIMELGRIVFLPGAARITSITATVGAAVQPGATVLNATSTDRQVAIDLNVNLQAKVKVGDEVTITLPDGQTVPGTVSTVGSVATSPDNDGQNDSNDSTPTIPVTVTLTDPAAAGQLDQAPVQIAITTASAPDALVVPVNALLAPANGGYAVEQVDAAGVHHLVPVTLGLFDDAHGLVQLTDASLKPGDHVVVPAS